MHSRDISHNYQEPEFWVDSLSMSICNATIDSSEINAGLAFVDYRYGIYNSEGTIYSSTLIFNDSDTPNNVLYIDYVCRCNIKANTAEWAHTQWYITQLDVTGYDSMLVTLEISGAYEICAESDGQQVEELIDKFNWQGKVFAKIIK
jgi:hypothetical protein